MAYEVLARKWRPQQFDDVVGQEHVTRTLCNAVQTGRIAHAYLFVGPRGIGKTSIARIFSKALNCEKGPTVTPCGECEACREIVSGNCMDVLEIDAASNTGVDHVRDLRETVKYSPVRGKYKVYIIDEVHMLSTAAFNALLKTLEEPPPHVIFMFATTEPEKVLPTIVSRCQRFNLRRIPVNLIVERLRMIAGAEALKLDEDAALAIARGAEGGMRDAQSALDQMISFTGKHVTEADVLEVFGLVSRQMLVRLTDAILDGDAAEVLRTVAELDRGGKDLQRLTLELLQYFRDLLVVINAGKDAARLDVLDRQLESLEKQAEKTSSARVLRVVGVLAETENKMRYALSRRTVLEVALLQAARAAKVVSLEAVLKRLNAVMAEGVAEPSRHKEDSDLRQETPQTAPPREVPRMTAAVPAAPAVSAEADAEGELVRLREMWPGIIERTGRTNQEARPALADTVVLDLNEKCLLVGVDEEFSEELNQLESPRVKKALARAVSSALNRQISLEFKISRGEHMRQQSAARGDGINAEEAVTSREDLMKNEAVKATLDMFGGTVTEIKKARQGEV